MRDFRDATAMSPAPRKAVKDKSATLTHSESSADAGGGHGVKRRNFCLCNSSRLVPAARAGVRNRKSMLENARRASCIAIEAAQPRYHTTKTRS
jgi:hypothetical protein